MQDIRLPFTSDRERRTSDDILRDQLTYIGNRGIAGNRGRGWDFEVGPIQALDRYVKETQSYYYTMSSYIRFYRRVDVDPDKFKRQSSVIVEWAAAAGHNAKFGKRPWVATVPVEKQLDQLDTEDNTDTDDTDLESETPSLIPLREVGIIRPGKFFDHLYNLESQITILLSSLQAAADSDMVNRFHALLWGEPGGGKTEILLSTARLLRHLGINFITLDATSTTEAGMRKSLLDEDAIPPEIIIIEEVEKVVSDNSLRWLLGIMDDRATIQQANYRKTASRKVPALVLATANDYEQLRKMMAGALLSRFSSEIFCPRADRATLARILERDVKKLANGRLEWIEPTLTFCHDEQRITDPRKLRRVCLSGKDQLLDGSYQVHLRKTTRDTTAGVSTLPTVPSASTSPVDTAALAALFTQTEGNTS